MLRNFVGEQVDKRGDMINMAIDFYKKLLKKDIIGT